jgi:hypothetical protein
MKKIIKEQAPTVVADKDKLQRALEITNKLQRALKITRYIQQGSQITR